MPPLQKEECKKHDFLRLIGDYDLCLQCGVCVPQRKELHPPLRPIHMIILEEIRKIYPQHFYMNRNCFFYSQMFEYIFQKKVYRITIMGETRGGKSEEAQTVALNYTLIFNALYERGHYAKLQEELASEGVKFEKVTIDTEYIHANQSAYLYYLRDNTREKKLIFGQMHIIDEERDNAGGIGTFSEDIEVENLNNIVAKFCQCEIWITPKRFQLMNTPYGLNCLIKDERTRTNWSLIYKLEMSSGGIREQNFLGWVGICLHENKTLRDAYNQKKNSWVTQELEGTINERARRRMIAVQHFLNDMNFMQFKVGKDGNIKYHHGVETMKFLVEQAMMEQKIDQFNDTEIERIVYGVRALGEKKFGQQHDA